MFDLLTAVFLLLLAYVATREPVKRRFLAWLFPSEEPVRHWAISEILDELDNVAFQRVIDYYRAHQGRLVLEAIELGYDPTSSEEMHYFTMQYLRVNRLADV